MLVAALARRAGSLSRSGAIAAAITGTAAVAAGWRWAALLLAFFIPATLLSRWRAGRKAALTSGVLGKGGTRDAVQVLANGGPFLLAAIGALLAPAAASWWMLAAGALAAASSDTWATETGTALGGTPRSIVHGRLLLPGESGGVTLIGTLGGGAGALVAGIAGAWLSPAALTMGGAIRTTIGIASAGMLGMLVDSLLGATVQERRRCPACGTRTERLVHACGARTLHAGGVRRLGNDAVNVLATVTGGAAALALGRWLRVA